MAHDERLPAGRGEMAAVPEQIEQHARTVTTLAERVLQAAHAGTLVSLDSAAYGQLCAFMPALMRPLQDRVMELTRHCADALDQSATNLHTVAAAYRTVDGAAAGRLMGIDRHE